MDIDDEAMRERVLRSETKVPLVAVDLSVRKRKPLTQEQLEDRRRKVKRSGGGGEVEEEEKKKKKKGNERDRREKSVG